MGTESREQFKRRLLLQGDWEAYNELRLSYRMDGCTAKEANQRAAAKFPPKSTYDEVAQRARRSDEFSPGAVGGSDLRNDYLWVYHHLDIVDVKSEDAPSSGAWSLLFRCRSSDDFLSDFYRCLQKLLPSRSELDRELDMDDDGRDLQQLIRSVRDGG